LPKLKDMNYLLKLKFQHRAELNNISPSESKRSPFKTLLDNESAKPGGLT
jgi:hypothetical protein